LNLKRNKKTFVLTSIILAVFIIIPVFLTGCVRGMSPIGWSGIAVADGTLYAGSKEGRLISIDSNKNTILVRAEAIKTASSGGGTSTACGGSAPAVAIYGTPALTEVPVLGKLVYIAGYNGKVYAYTADSLQQRWIYPIEGNLQPIVSAVVVSGDSLYFGCTDGYVYSLDVATGGLKWKFNTGGEIWATPVIDNNLLIIGSFNKTVFAIDANAGTEKWRFSTGSTNVAPPVILNGTVYIGSLDRNLYALNAADGKERWKFSGDNCRSGYRYNENPGYVDVCFGYDIYGFRCVRNAPAAK